MCLMPVVTFYWLNQIADKLVKESDTVSKVTSVLLSKMLGMRGDCKIQHAQFSQRFELCDGHVGSTYDQTRTHFGTIPWVKPSINMFMVELWPELRSRRAPMIGAAVLCVCLLSRTILRGGESYGVFRRD